MSKLANASFTKLTGKSGAVKECLVIPVDDAHLFVGEKGIYLDLVAFEYRNKKQEYTHFVKQNFRKEMYDGMSKVEFNKQPTVGIARNFDDKKMQATNEYEPNDSELPF